LPLLGLAWLGWKIVDENRTSRDVRHAEQRDQALALAATTLRRVLAEADERLTAFASAQPGADPGAALPAPMRSAALVSLDRRGFVGRSGALLPFYPLIPDRDVPAETVFATADHAEFHDGPAAAIAALRPLAQVEDPAIRAEALLRLARNHRRTGDVSRAAATYRELARLEETRVAGMPAGYAAHQGLGALLASTDRPADLFETANAFRAALDAGWWPLTRAQYEVASANLTKWLGPAPDGSSVAERLALAEAIETSWRLWAGGGPTDASGRGSIRTARGPVLVLTRATPDRVAFLAAGPRFLHEAWLAAVSRDPAPPGAIAFALTDADGVPVLGTLDVVRTGQSVLPPSETSLPWTVHAMRAAAPGHGLDRASIFGLSVVVLAAALIVGGAYVIGRAIARDVAVANLQSDFVSAVSHEFRTPLTTLRQLSELLASGRVSSDARRQEFYETLLAESGRLHRLVEGLLNFGRMEAGAAEYRLEEVDVAVLVRDVVAEFHREVPHAGNGVTVTAASAVPLVRADRPALSRVIWNLLDNAVKYSPDNRAVQVDVGVDAGRVELRVRDRGIGIPPHERAAIFGKFVRGDAARRTNIQGAGVGLAIVRRIVEAHGGEIRVESAVAEGSTFTVTLPTSGGPPSEPAVEVRLGVGG
jgi:signal transduction histidine kinase